MIDTDIMTIAVMGHEEPAKFAPQDLTRHQLESEHERTMDPDGAMLYIDTGGES